MWHLQELRDLQFPRLMKPVVVSFQRRCIIGRNLIGPFIRVPASILLLLAVHNLEDAAEDISQPLEWVLVKLYKPAITARHCGCPLLAWLVQFDTNKV